MKNAALIAAIAESTYHHSSAIEMYRCATVNTTPPRMPTPGKRRKAAKLRARKRK